MLKHSTLFLHLFSGLTILFSSGCLYLKLDPIHPITQLENVPAIVTWADCVTMAGKEHPELRAAEEVVKQARTDWQQAFEGFLPDMSGRFTRKKQQVDSAKPTNDFTFTTSVTEELFSGFENTAEILKARRSYRAELYNYKDIESRIALDVREAFVRLLHAQELVVLRSSIAERRKLNEEIVRLRYEAGREHSGSLKRAEAISNEAEFDRREAERKIVIERNALARELGGRFGIEMAASGDLQLMIPPDPLGEPNFAELVEKIPSVMQRKELKDAAGADVIKEQSDFWPTVKGSANYSNTGRTPEMATKTWDIGLTIDFPMFSGGQQLGDVLSARSDQREAFYTLKDERDSAYADLIEQWSDLISGLEFVQVRKKFLEAAAERAEITRIQYQDGLVSFVDWDSVEEELVDSRISLLDAQRDAVLAEADWLRSQGLSFDAYRA